MNDKLVKKCLEILRRYHLPAQTICKEETYCDKARINFLKEAIPIIQSHYIVLMEKEYERGREDGKLETRKAVAEERLDRPELEKTLRSKISNLAVGMMIIMGKLKVEDLEEEDKDRFEEICQLTFDQILALYPDEKEVRKEVGEYLLTLETLQQFHQARLALRRGELPITGVEIDY